MDKISFVKTNNIISTFDKPNALFAVDASLNPYEGCLNNCVYCPYSSSSKVVIKTDFIHLLDKNIKQQGKKLHFGYGTKCEPYASQEKEFKLTRNGIELIIKNQFPLQVITKSEKVLDDLDIFKNYSKSGLLAVSVSLFSLDKKAVGVFEPNIIESKMRINILKELKAKNIFAGLVLSPIIPFVSDNKVDLSNIFEEASNADADYILPSVLLLEDKKVRERIFDALGKNYPKIKENFMHLYGKDKLPPPAYTQKIEKILIDLSKRYEIPLYLPIKDYVPNSISIRNELLK